MDAIARYPLKIVGRKVPLVEVMGLKVYVGADRHKFFHPALRDGRLSLAKYADRLAMEMTNPNGNVKTVASSPWRDGVFYANDRPAHDKHGIIASGPGRKPRRASADDLFPMFQWAWHVNSLSCGAFVSLGKKRYYLPTDPDAPYGPAACRRQIAALLMPDKRLINFYRLVPGAQPQFIDKLPVDAAPRKNGRTVVVTDHLASFRRVVVDRPFPKPNNENKSWVTHRKVAFTVSCASDNVHYDELCAGQLSLRSTAELVRVIKNGEVEEDLFSIPIVDNKLVLGPGRTVPLDQEEVQLVKLYEESEELGRREAVIKVGCGGGFASFEEFGLTFFLPMPHGGVHNQALKAGRFRRRVFREERIEIGYQEGKVFHEIGRVEFDKEGFVLDPQDLLGRKARKHARGQKPVILVKLMPELGRIEKQIWYGEKYSFGGVYRRLYLKPDQRYFDDLRTGRLVIRAIGDRLECFTVRQGVTEYIGSASRQDKRPLLELFPALQPPSASGLRGPAKFEGSAGLNLLKKLVGLKRTADLARGLAWLEEEAPLSSDLKEALAAEIRRLLPVASADVTAKARRRAGGAPADLKPVEDHGDLWEELGADLALPRDLLSSFGLKD